MKIQQLLIFSLLVLAGCSNSKKQKPNLFLGDWELINPKHSQLERSNVALDGVSFYMDSLDFFSDYMNNPIFNYRKYSIEGDSIAVEFENGTTTFGFRKKADTLFINDGKYLYKYVKLNSKVRNEANKVKFNSLNPGFETRYFFDLTLSQDGSFLYVSKSENNRILEGKLKEKYVAFIFDKLHNIELPIRVDSNEVVPAGDHIFTLEIFRNQTKADSLSYSRKIEGQYSRWLASILQSTPLWIDGAIKKEDPK